MSPALVTCYVQQLRLIEVGRETGTLPEDDFRAQFHRLVDLAEQALCRMEAAADGYDLFADSAILEAL